MCEIQESSSLFDQLSSSPSFRWADDTAAVQQSLPVKDPSLHAADCSALCCSGLEQSAGPRVPPPRQQLAAPLWSSCWWLLQLYKELRTQSLGRKRTAAGRASPHVSTGPLVSSSGTVHSSTPVYSFKMVDDFFLLFSVVCFLNVFLRYSSS